MMRTMTLICVLACLANALAAVPDRSWPSVEVTPLVDVPMRDAAIMRGPDGTYYLTGTLAAPAAGGTTRPAGLDFENGHVIKLWKSADLKEWVEVGVVWDIDNHKNAGEWNWQSYWRVPMEAEYRPPVRGVVAPELHHIKGNWYICFSMNGQGTGLIKSDSGKPEGPYVEVDQITTKGGDPSMFEDDDGSVYWLFDGGWIAKMTDDLTALGERPRLLVPSQDPAFLLEKKEAATRKYRLADDPVQVGKRGAFMFKRDGRYFLCAADYNSRLGRPCDDTWVAYSKEIYGPYSERHLMLPHGGGVTVFRGPGETDYASFYGADQRALLQGRPSFVPLAWTSAQDWDVYFFGKHESFPRKPQHVFTEAGPWSRLKPLKFEEQMRDISILNAPDGFYYLTCSGVGRPGELVVYRSKDMEAWEEFKVVWRYDDIEWLEKKVAPIEGDSREAGRARFARTIWDVGMKHVEGTYWIWFNIFPSDLGGPGHHGSGVLRSKSGNAEGPYESVGRKGGHYASDSGGGAPRPFVGADGKLYANAVINWKPLVAEANLAQDGDWRKLWGWKPVDIGKGVAMGSDGWGTTHYLAGEYVFLAVRWGGPVFNPHVEHGGKHHGTYDFSYSTGPTPWGPFGRPKPMARNGGIFRDKQGEWWMIFFGNDGSGPWWQRPGLVPLTITSAPGDVSIDVKMAPYTERELRIMGGGEPAEVKRVTNSLP